MKEVERIIQAEEQRQQDTLDLIPSENYASADVRAALGSVFTNKYAEGYPGRRFYGGQTHTDEIEQLAIDRTKALFGADHANVQPHSGAPANWAVYQAWLEPGDTVLAMDLSHGGHLTHGDPVTASSHLYDFIRYGMKDVSTGEIDYEEMRRLTQQHRPKLILAGFSSYPRELDYAKFTAIGNEVGAVLMADVAHIAGLIAAGELANPLDAGFHVMSMTTHKSLRGPRGGLIVSNGNVGNPLKEPEHTIDNLPTLIDRAVFPGLQGGPHMNAIAAKAVALAEADTDAFRTYARQVLANAQALADELIKHGCTLITGGTDNHLLLIDTMASFNLGGQATQATLETIGLTVNKNVLPDDTRPRFDPSGIRLGTPAVTTRGLGGDEMRQLARYICEALANPEDEQLLKRLREETLKLSRRFPLPG